MITTNRNVFIGIHVTPNVKKALVKEVEKRRDKTDDSRFSQSRLVYELLKEGLIKEGHIELQHDQE